MAYNASIVIYVSCLTNMQFFLTEMDTEKGWDTSDNTVQGYIHNQTQKWKCGRGFSPQRRSKNSRMCPGDNMIRGAVIHQLRRLQDHLKCLHTNRGGSGKEQK